MGMNSGKVMFAPISVSTTNDSKALSNLFGNGLFLSLKQDLTSILTKNGKDKNFALFQALGHSSNEILAEILPHDPHVVMKFNPNDYKLRMRYIYQRTILGNKTVDNSSTKVSFSTVDQLWFDPGLLNNNTRRGGACCIKIDNPSPIQNGTDFLLVGVGHTRTGMRLPNDTVIPRYNYFSYFYAFDPEPNYRVLARSGLFCLPFGNENEDKINRNLILSRKRKLFLNNEQFNCPRIHFVSSMIQKDSNTSNVIISYGINDCSYRFIEIEKSE